METIPQNIQVFNLTSIALFDRLYAAFPTPIDINPGSLYKEVLPEEATFENGFNFEDAAQGSFKWLAEEGFIRSEPCNSDGTFVQARLTLKGLTAVGYMPSSIKVKEKQESLIDKIRQVLSSAAEKTAAEAAKVVLTQVFANAVRIVSSALQR